VAILTDLARLKLDPDSLSLFPAAKISRPIFSSILTNLVHLKLDPGINTVSVHMFPDPKIALEVLEGLPKLENRKKCWEALTRD